MARMDRRRFLSTVAGGALASRLSAQPAQKPNIVLIYADDVGYGDISCYGATRVQTPNLDRLAAGGVRFTNAHASSATCTPSRYSLLTGEYAWRKKGTGVLPGDATLIIPTGRQTLPGMLQKQGYRTGAVGKWHLGLGSGQRRLERRDSPRPARGRLRLLLHHPGHRRPRAVRLRREPPRRQPRPERPDPRQLRPPDRRRADRQGESRAAAHASEPRPRHGDRQRHARIGYMTGGKSALWVDEDIADTITAKAVNFIEQNKARPFFLYFATHDIHVPRVPQSAVRRQDADGSARRRHRRARLVGRAGARHARPQRPDATTRS